MRIEQDRLGQIKNYVYIGSSALLFLVWVLSLAAITQQGSGDGRLGWVFGLCFLTIPLLIYQSLTPIWSRTARFSEPHAHCAVDGLLTLLWLSAWTLLASYVTSGKGKGDLKNESGDLESGCANFAWGTPAKCTISEADIVFSVVMMLCFIATSFFSFKVLMEYRRTGIAPNTAYLSSGGKVRKNDISYPQQTHEYKEDDEAFDPRLNLGVDDQRDNGYSFEVQRVQGGAPTGDYGGLGQSGPYAGNGGYASIPNPGDGGYEPNERPTSFGGPLNRI